MPQGQKDRNRESESRTRRCQAECIYPTSYRQAHCSLSSAHRMLISASWPWAAWAYPNSPICKGAHLYHMCRTKGRVAPHCSLTLALSVCVTRMSPACRPQLRRPASCPRQCHQLRTSCFPQAPTRASQVMLASVMIPATSTSDAL